jgi:hypothetical protein
LKIDDQRLACFPDAPEERKPLQNGLVESHPLDPLNGMNSQNRQNQVQVRGDPFPIQVVDVVGHSLDIILQEWVAEFPAHGVGNHGSEIAAGDVKLAAGGNSHPGHRELAAGFTWSAGSAPMIDCIIRLFIGLPESPRSMVREAFLR